MRREEKRKEERERGSERVEKGDDNVWARWLHGWNGYREITTELCVSKGKGKGGEGMRFACNDGNDRHVWRFEPIGGSI